MREKLAVQDGGKADNLPALQNADLEPAPKGEIEMNSFRTQIQSDDVSIYGLDRPQLKGLANGSDYEISPNTFYVSWNCELEIREWGIKDICCYVTGIEGEFEITYFAEDGDEKDSETIEFDFDAFKDKIEWDVEDRNGCISPNTLDIYYDRQSVSVQG